MPEYLAPGVYVEEVDTGSKPIEGVSTSTAGMVGVTERGPVNVPILLTSFGEFQRWFGGHLNHRVYSENGRLHSYLPHAVEGFFTNGGKRLYVVRVLDAAAADRAEFELHDRGDANPIESVLLLPAQEGHGDTAHPLFVLDGAALTAADAGQTFRLGDGSLAEYRQLDTVLEASESTHVPLHLPLSRTHGESTSVNHINRVVVAFPSAADATLRVETDVDAGRDQAMMTGAAEDIGDLNSEINLGNPQHLEIGADGHAEYRFVTGVTIDPDDNTRAEVEVDSPLMLDHAAGEIITRLNVDPGAGGVNVDVDTLPQGVRVGSSVAFVADRNGNFDEPMELVIFDPGRDDAEVRRMGRLRLLTLSQANESFCHPTTVVEAVTLADDGAVAAKELTRDARAGDSAIALDSRQGLDDHDILRIGAGANTEYVTIDQLPNRAIGGADPGNVILTHAVRLEHVDGTEVRLQDPPELVAGRPATTLVFGLRADATQVAVSDGTDFAADDLVRFTTPAGDTFFNSLSDVDDLDPRLVSWTEPLAHTHQAGAPVVERDALVTVQALDHGIWGNRLRISVEDEPTGLLSRTALLEIVGARRLRLASIAGVERGTVLELLDPVTRVPIGDRLKVADVDRTENTVTLDEDLDTDHRDAEAALPAGTFLSLRSREFRLTVYLLAQPDPAVPSRNNALIDSEVFRHLSMDPRHSRYLETVIGAIDGDARLADGRPEGASQYTRVLDLAPDEDAALSIRLGPEALVDTLPNGTQRPARHALSGGDDAIASLINETYLGRDAEDPENRTGLHGLRNIEQISLVAVPGQTTPAIQQALIDHCELMRYRFAVLDGPPPPGDTLSDVQTQRQQFDTRYAALYHPWLLIPDPFPTNLDRIADYPIPPSGHMLGIYARTDIERGVHKAPANEVLRGIIGLQRSLKKGEHDILNPFPVNINVIRDFRPNNRGIRVWGGRVITSDPDWKYVNVRRLLIFLEASIERGLQWVVFEPNAEPLWARVRRTISNFLTVVWRNGALEGTKPAEAFYVKCDRTTMTQTDIDNGRLICVIGVAPVKPAEFVIIRIGLWTAYAEA